MQEVTSGGDVQHLVNKITQLEAQLHPLSGRLLQLESRAPPPGIGAQAAAAEPGSLLGSAGQLQDQQLAWLETELRRVDAEVRALQHGGAGSRDWREERRKPQKLAPPRPFKDKGKAADRSFKEWVSQSLGWLAQQIPDGKEVLL